MGYYLFNGSGYPRPFVYDTQTSEFSPVALPSWLLEASPADVNDNNIMVGTGVGPIAGQRGFVCDLNTGVWTELVPQNPPIGWSGATGINNSNVVCGWRSIDDGGDPVNPQTAFLWNAKAFTDLGVMNGPISHATDIADNGTVVGWTGSGISSNEARAFIWRDGNLRILLPVPGGLSSLAHAISPNGEYVAITGRTPPNGYRRPFLWRDGAFINLGFPRGFDIGFAEDVNSSGALVGGLRSFTGLGDEAFVWQQGLFRRIDALVGAPSFTTEMATTVSESGTIVVVRSGAEVLSTVLTPVVVAGDAAPNCRVDVDDLLTVIGWWGPGNSPGDITGDGIVNIDDLLIVIDNWTH